MTDTTGREYRYQVDYTLPTGRMYHVRCDDWTEFQEAVKNIEGIIPAIATPTPVIPTQQTGTLACEICGRPLSAEKRIVSKKNNRAYWVRDCTSGDRSHKGTIRPAD